MAKQGSWKFLVRATTQQSQETPELPPVTTRGMQGREKPPAHLAPAEEHIQVRDHRPLAAAPLEGSDPIGLQEWGGDDGSQEHGRLAVIPDCVLEPAALQPAGAQLIEEDVPPPGGRPTLDGGSG